jgi:hypothetical protein
MTDRLSLVLSKFEKVSGTKNRFKALCPAHGDRTPSLSITEGDDGRVLLHCFGGCSFDSILTAMGLSIVELFPPNGSLSKATLAGISRRELSTAVDFEKTILYFVKADEAKGREIVPSDIERAQLALQRITKAKALV